MRGQITAQKVIIRGEVQGQISAEAVELGDILHQDLSIESGAFLEGNCRHKERPALPTAQISAPDDASDTARVVNG